MEESALPCSVITSHGECSNENDILQPVVPYVDLTQQNLKIKPEESDSLGSVTVYELVSINVWPQEDPAATVLQEQTIPPTNNGASKNEDSATVPRKRKMKRPYSPENQIGSKKLGDKRKGIKNQKSSIHIPGVSAPNAPEMETNGKPFSCDRCHSPFVVNPARTHRLNSKRKYRPRKQKDPSTKKVLMVLCNACGLAMVRNKWREKQRKDPPSPEDKETYLKKAAEFASSLATTLQNPDAQRLYCPAFKSSPCQCLQNYIISEGNDNGGVEKRAMHLLTLLKDARQLAKQKVTQNVTEDTEEAKDKTESEKKGKQKQQHPRGLHKRKSKAFEEFVLTNRQYLRKELKLCERAVQRILLYSNNFLHKKLKTSPNRRCRLERSIGKNARGLLKPISELVNEPCCKDRCVTMAQTHSKLLENWRAMAKKGQCEARRVLAEMLTPSGGAKANCYRFISMVTGCSCATICVVNEQMKRTQGEREPPEHGLKKWWRDHPKDKEKPNVSGNQSSRADETDEDNPAAVMDVASIHIPSREELESLCPQEATMQLQLQREKLIEAQKQLLEQQAQIQQQMKQTKSKSNSSKQQVSASSEKDIPIPVLTTHPTFESRNLETVTVLAPADSSETSADVLTRSTTQQVLHILELPTTSSSVITNLTENALSQPTISVMTSTGEFEPLTDLSVSLEGRGQATFSNVVILPETALDTSAISSSASAQGTSVISYSPPVETVDSMPSIIPSQDQQACDTVTSSIESVSDTSKTDMGSFQFYGVMESSSTNLIHFKY